MVGASGHDSKLPQLYTMGVEVGLQPARLLLEPPELLAQTMGFLPRLCIKQRFEMSKQCMNVA